MERSQARSGMRPSSGQGNASPATASVILERRRPAEGQKVSAARSRGDLERTSVLAQSPIRLRIERLGFLVDELAIDLLDLANIDILANVPRVWIDRHWPARAHPLHALNRGNGLRR